MGTPMNMMPTNMFMGQQPGLPLNSFPNLSANFMPGGEGGPGGEKGGLLGNLENIPINWLPKNILYTQKVEPDPSIEPNQTLYVKNLNDRVSVKTMKARLQELFGKFEVLDIVIMKSFWRRGQAWVIFSSVENATKAQQEFNGFLLYGHAMQINYALEKSHLVAKMNGTFVPKADKGVKMKPRRIRQKELLYFQQHGMPPAMPPGPMGLVPGPVTPDLERAILMAQQKASELSFGFPPQNVMNKTLFVENLPDKVANADVANLFNKIPGFIEARVIAPRRVAFIDFDHENNSNYALQVLQGQLINGQPVKISFAKH